MTASTFLFRIIAIAAILMMTFGSTQPVYATPNNDNFANAIRIDNLPAEIYTDTVGATFEADEPYPECAYGDPVKTVWYTYTPMESATLRLSYHYEALAVYKGASLDSLTPVRCINGWSDGGAFPAEAGVTYYLQLSTYADEENIGLWLYLAPPPSVELSVWPEEPSIYDDYVTFRGYVWDDPGEVYDGSCLWTLWDGTTLSDCYFTYKFTKDGDYPLSTNT